MSSLRDRRLLRERELDQDVARAQLATQLVAIAFETSVDDIQGDARSGRIARARQVAMYLTLVGFGLSLARVGAAFARDRSTVKYAVDKVEEWRDDPVFDGTLAALEACLRAAPSASFP